MLSEKKGILTSSSPLCSHLICFSCLIALASALSAVLKRSEDNRYSCLIPDFGGIASNCSIGRCWQWVSYLSFYYAEDVPSGPTFSKTVILKMLDFLISIGMIMRFLSLSPFSGLLNLLNLLTGICWTIPAFQR